MSVSCNIVKAQDFALKTNVLYDATATINLGAEVGLAPKWTFDLSGNYNPFVMPGGKLWKHAMAQPEFRYWFCESFQGHFIGISGKYTQFNVGGIYVPKVFHKVESSGYFLNDLLNARSEGWAVGAGLTYGYAWPISRRWNMEFTIGAGWWYTQYDRYESRKCGLFQKSVNQHAIGLTDIGLSFIYLIK